MMHDLKRKRLYLNDNIKKGIGLSAFFLWIICTIQINGQETPDWVFPPVSVTASRLSEVVSRYFIKNISIDKDDIDKLPVRSLADLLACLSNLTSQPRGNPNAQMDFSLRGTTFEQVLILVDGIPVNDPQTGHHNSDIPVTFNDIERIDILAGPASAVCGSSAIGGIVSIHTKKINSKNTAFSVTGGSFNTASFSANHSFKTGSTYHRAGVELRKSDGYRAETDYCNQIYSYRFRRNSAKTEIEGSTGYIKKDFGANNFYADFPSHEKTSAGNIHMRVRYLMTKASRFQFRIYGKRHTDDFILDVARPQFYQANHQTGIWGAEFQGDWQWEDKIHTNFGIDVRQESIQSDQLGNHTQKRLALYCESACILNARWILHSGFRLIHGYEWGNVFNPTIQGVYKLNPSIYFNYSISRVFRSPTFTERYYQSPANLGDPNINPEYGWIQEAGLNIRKSNHHMSLLIFHRNESHRIDWIRKPDETQWQATNVAGSAVIGCSIDFNTRLLNYYTGFSVTGLLNPESPSQYFESKYPYNTLNADLTFFLSSFLPLGLTQTLIVNYASFEYLDSYTVIHYRLSKEIGKFRIDFDFHNITDSDYETVAGIPMPGFNWMAGLNCQLH